MQRRVLILPLAAVVIAGLCAYKLSRSDEAADPNQPIVITRRAPFFELYNQRKPPQLVRLESFIGRHQIVLVFFDPETGLEGDPVFAWLIEHADALKSENVEAFGISDALPQTHRKMLEDLAGEDESPLFQLLSDLDHNVHRLYGRFDAQAQKPIPGVFLIDRAGNLPSNRSHPLPLENPVANLREAFAVE